MAYVLEKMEKDDSSSDDNEDSGDSGDSGDEVNKDDGGDEQSDIDSIGSKIRDRSLDNTIGFEPV